MDTLRAALKEAGMTQRELADHVGVTQPAVNQWVNGTTPVPPFRLEQLEDLLGWVPEETTAQKVKRDLMGFYRTRRTPMAYLLAQPGAELAHLAKDARTRKPQGMGTQEDAEYVLQRWAQWFRTDKDKLLLIADGQAFLKPATIKLAADANFQLPWLGIHLPGESVTVAEQLADFYRRQISAGHETRAAADADWQNFRVKPVWLPIDPDKGRAQALELLEGRNFSDAYYEQWRDSMEEQYGN